MGTFLGTRAGDVTDVTEVGGERVAAVAVYRHEPPRSSDSPTFCHRMRLSGRIFSHEVYGMLVLDHGLDGALTSAA